ncbi:amidohydrolase family protein [Thalassotalea crassostreae]|uniref:amidohydrolase family protein n=1 Tax=Thalassotalea crassostreae TaxID=1763536 RepID=UPI000839315A|nr:amidohydrolase family protein [Thalassotalea crassostreae]
MRIDSHQHFWQVSRGDYDWLTPDLQLLYKDFLPTDIQPLLKQAQITKTILVQAAATTQETDFMLKLAQQHNFIAGVVGWVDFESEQGLIDLQRFSQNSLFKGVRPMLQDIDDANWILNPKFAPIFEKLISKDLTFDALVLPKHLDVIITLSNRYPELNIVIDHGAKPEIESGETADWYEKMAVIAASANVYCKLSGLVTEAGEKPELSTIAPYMHHLLKCFGSKRLMWGSDWPVINLASDYNQWVKQVEKFVLPLTAQEQQSIWATTAQNFYTIDC